MQANDFDCFNMNKAENKRNLQDWMFCLISRELIFWFNWAINFKNFAVDSFLSIYREKAKLLYFG